MESEKRPKFYEQLSFSEKKKVRESLERLKELRKGQKDFFIRKFIKPIDDLINNIDDAKASKIPLSHLVKRNKSFSKYITGIFDKIGGQE